MSEAVRKPAIFCISTYEKGQAFLREAAQQGCEVNLLTVDKLRDANWPREAITHLFTMPEGLTPEQILNTVSYFARTHPIDRIVALDEFDLEAAALLREHMRLPGMGQSETRFFRDKLAMRTGARAGGVAVPDFIRVFNYDDLRAFMAHVPGPWLLKPRSNASAIGIKTIQEPEELFPILDQLGDEQSHYVLERFVTGEVYHVEGVTWGGKLLFSQPCKYGKPPMQTMHQGGVFTTRTLSKDSAEEQALCEIHRRVLQALGLRNGVTHTEFIRSAVDGQFYFLETAARVGGAFIAEVVEFATGLNPWVEWARIEAALAQGREYALPPLRRDYAGSVICLAKQSEPDLSAYADPEIALRLHKHHHAGILLQSPSAERVQELVDGYAVRFLEDFCAVMAVPDRPTA
ncbi:ATP-grasp domain-containing protein [Granulicella rosea]|uniref:ATP-grasp domain-containing protein n=1 Tax=Granulicella rosea TaxID=474952 RepID=A0A239EYD7_9BACT|nr:ATP-grasp domain-containing protein [Granulicella rosea]SNS48912.1 ATP-grasp domain-containing protein [Granulicella rosea]